MKQFLSGLFAIFLATNINATEKEISSTITGVTVFRNGAQVTRTTKATIPAGNTILKFTGISANINPQSIQLGATGDFTILSVTHQLNYFKEPEPKEETEKLRSEREKLSEELNREQAILQVYAEEEAMILANKAIGGQQSGVNIEDLKANAAFYRSRLTDIKLSKLDQDKKIKTLTEAIQKIDQQLNQLSAQRKSISTSEVLVAVSSKNPVNANFELSYLAYNASWSPTYDLRVKDIDSPVMLDYKASVSQNSGEDWTNVKLHLSTGNPFVSGTRPVLSDWWLQFYDQYPVATGRQPRGLRMEKLKESQIYNDGVTVEEEVMIPNVEVVDNTTTMEFQIEEKYDIPSNGKAYVVNIQQHSLPASYEYYVAPKLDRDAFLTALITDWEQYNLLSGMANLYFEGTYIGKSLLNVAETGDTLPISLGRDKNIIVERTREKQYSDKQFIGNKKTETIGWTIALRNKKKQQLKLVVEDQYPLSTNDEIEVKLEAHKGAKVDEASGKLTWELELKPGEEKELEFRYSVKYPKKRKLILE